MKKINIILLSSLLLIGALNIKAQDDDKPGKLGIRAGYQLSSIETDEDQLGGFYLGLFKYKKIAPLFRFGSGLEYYQNGMVSSSNSDTKLVLHTVSIPVLMQVKLGPIYAVGGFGANFKVAEQLYFAGEKFDIPDNQKSNVFDVPAIIGLGAKFLMFSAEIRYHYGLLEVNENYDGNNQAIQFGFGVSF